MRRLSTSTLTRLMPVLAVLALGAIPSAAEAAPAGVTPVCRARVVHSEELPYAWQGSWLARVTLAVVAPDGGVFQTTVTQTIPWQRSAPRYGETYWLRCDPSASEVFY
jgi:hypothetical protein